MCLTFSIHECTFFFLQANHNVQAKHLRFLQKDGEFTGIVFAKFEEESQATSAFESLRQAKIHGTKIRVEFQRADRGNTFHKQRNSQS